MQTTIPNQDAATPPRSFFLRHHRLSERLLILMTPIALFSALAPIGLAIQLAGWVVLFAVFFASAVLDRHRARESGVASERDDGGRPPGRAPRPNRAAPWFVPADDDSDDWLGPFNPHTGLPLDVSPYSVQSVDEEVTNASGFDA
jgi:hypothetical protein